MTVTAIVHVVAMRLLHASVVEESVIARRLNYHQFIGFA